MRAFEFVKEGKIRGRDGRACWKGYRYAGQENGKDKCVKVGEDWSKTNKKDQTDGMSQKAVDAYRRENPGSKLKTAVTKDPSKIKKGSKDDSRRKSFCARSNGQRKQHNIDCSKTPDKPICKARRRWNCESVEEMERLLVQGRQFVAELRENFKDGRNPQDKGDSKRHGVPTKASVSTLRKIAKQGGRRGQLAHWMANMKAGRKKAAEK